MARLSDSGEDVVGRIRLPQLLLLARTLLLRPLGVGFRIGALMSAVVLVAIGVVPAPAESMYFAAQPGFCQPCCAVARCCSL